MQKNAVGWFEIPVENMERAIAFYENVLKVKLKRNKIGNHDMAWFPWEDGSYGSGGSLVCHPEFYRPSKNGVLIYFTAPSGDLNNELAHVNKAGGKVVGEKEKISEEHGFLAIIIDSEGNRVALHSKK